MSDVFALDTAGQGALEAEVARNPVSPDELSAGALHGVGAGIGEGVMRGGARVGQFIGMGLGGALSIEEKALGYDEGTLTDPFFKFVDEHVNSAVDYWTPNAAEVGTAGRVLGGLAEIALPLMAGGGNPALLIGSQEMGTATDLAREGVDAQAAVGVGVAQGAAAVVGFRIPFLGRSLLSRAASGAAGNLAVNAGTTAAQRKVLESAGETEAAKQFNYLDPEARFTDLLTGLAFGGIEHIRVRSTERAAAATAANARHFQEQTAPGVPADVHSAVAHTEAMEQAITQLLNGDPVTVPEAVMDAHFKAPPEALRKNFVTPDATQDSALEFLAKAGGVDSAAMAREGFDPADFGDHRVGIRRAFHRKGMSIESAGERLAQAGYPVTDASGAVDKTQVLDMLDNEVRGTKEYSRNRSNDALAQEYEQHAEAHAQGASEIPVAESLRPAERVIETRFREQVAGDVEGAMREYAKLPDSEGGRILNTDTARELSPDYRANRTQSAAVHEPASWLVKQMYTRLLAQEPGPGHEPRVLFTGGGTGAGKSTAIRQLADSLMQSAQIVYDTNLNGLQSSIAKIEQALQAGKDVEILYVARDPVQALTKGALPRAMRMGRTVPLVEHARTHVGSVEAIQRIAEHYEGDPRVHIEVIDNNHGKDRAQLGALEKLPKGEYDAVLGKLYDALQSEHAAGRISDAVYRATLGDLTPDAAEPGAAQGSKPPVRAGRGGQSEPARAGSKVAADDPLTAYLRERLQESDIQVPTGALDEDGVPVTRSAREQLADIDAEIADAEMMGHGIMAAVSCLIDRGVAA